MEGVNVNRPIIAVLLLVLASLAAAAQAVYVVLLKNGTRIVARQKYAIKGGNALIVLKNGTLTSVPLSQVDVPATDKLNAENLGDAIILEWADKGQAPLATPMPTPSVTSLGHIRAGEGSPVGEAAGPTPTPGIAYRAARFPDEQVDQAFQQGLESYHLYLYRSSQGTRPDYYFLEIQVNGQAEVLRALQAVATTYHLLQEKAPKRAPQRVELQLLNESGREAGVFRISVDDARQLATGEVKPEDFFVQHVIF